MMRHNNYYKCISFLNTGETNIKDSSGFETTFRTPICDALNAPAVITGLTYHERRERFGKKGQN